jgi:hypothetical protein
MQNSSLLTPYTYLARRLKKGNQLEIYNCCSEIGLLLAEYPPSAQDIRLVRVALARRMNEDPVIPYIMTLLAAHEHALLNKENKEEERKIAIFAASKLV